MTETATAEPGAAARPAAVPTSSGPGIPRERLILALLLIGTAAAYCWNLTAGGWANEFYAAAVQSGTLSWKAFLFGSLDPGNIVTVDKTPLSLWPMELSGRIFGFSSASMLLPEVVLGVASVALLWATVRRVFGPAAGLLAGLVLALTPVAALMFRYNNPDAMLTFLIIAAAWAMTRALGDGRWRWLVLCGAFVGLGFLAKQLQVMLVVPGLALAYLVAGPPRLGKRIAQLCAAVAGLLVAAGWWVLIAQLWPADSRPYFGGSENNSILDLTVGYNGIQRLDTSGFGPRAGEPGITRLFGPELAGQITWLVPAALVLLVTGLVLRGRGSRTDSVRGALVLWGGWLVVSGLVFSFMNGTFHQYYTMTMAPAVAALVGGAGVLVWRARERGWVRAVLAVSVLLTVAMAWVTLSRTTDFVPWLRWVVLVAGIVAAVGLVVRTRAGIAAAVLAVLVGLAGPVSYTVDTLANSSDSGGFGGAGPQVPGTGWGPQGGHKGGDGPGSNAGGAQPANGAQPGNAAQPGKADKPADAAKPGRGHGGPGWGSGPSSQIVALLKSDAGRFTWAGSAVSSHGANSYQLAADVPVMSIGGFSGGDPAPTLAQFQQYVAQGRIHYFIAEEDRGPRHDADSEATKITTWVEQHYTPTTVDGTSVYDLTAPKR
ncbi:glycosyltransferase family 39 protein [Nocardia miyunensis]|uniref:glycosyltransferase family 39 protein n=1 Tax=Nocardia miyunensis TaxID=282684 RepID=UPI0009FE5DCE|nr:glycosyltransferase family 39 protein [Nocardia miyunensis]